MGANPRNYELVRQIRAGRSWRSYLARDKGGLPSTLTFFRSGDASAVRLAAERVAGLCGEHVAATHGAFRDRESGELVVISEYIPGIDMFEATRSLSPIQMLAIFSQAIDGISFIHRSGFLHLNIKPSRIFVDLERVSPVAKISDFGFAVPKAGLGAKFGGSAFYMAPEVAMDVREKIDERADLYSMAIAMYYCLTGHQPFCERAVAGGDAARLADIVRKEAELTVPPSKLRSDVPKDMDKMIMGLISKDAGGRAHRKASSLLNSIYERWPEACAAMPPEGASSLVSLDGE